MSGASTEVGEGPDGEAAASADQAPWLAFGDLMAGLLGAFVLVVVALVASQLDLSEQLAREQQQRQAEAQRRMALEQALGPLRARIERCERLELRGQPAERHACR